MDGAARFIAEQASGRPDGVRALMKLVGGYIEANEPNGAEECFLEIGRLCSLEHAPGVAMHEVPPDSMIPEFDEDDLNYDERYGGQFGLDKIVDRDDEYYDGDKDQDH